MVKGTGTKQGVKPSFPLQMHIISLVNAILYAIAYSVHVRAGARDTINVRNAYPCVVVCCRLLSVTNVCKRLLSVVNVCCRINNYPFVVVCCRITFHVRAVSQSANAQPISQAMTTKSHRAKRGVAMPSHAQPKSQKFHHAPSNSPPPLSKKDLLSFRRSNRRTGV